MSLNRLWYLSFIQHILSTADFVSAPFCHILPPRPPPPPDSGRCGRHSTQVRGVACSLVKGLPPARPPPNFSIPLFPAPVSIYLGQTGFGPARLLRISRPLRTIRSSPPLPKDQCNAPSHMSPAPVLPRHKQAGSGSVVPADALLITHHCPRCPQRRAAGQICRLPSSLRTAVHGRAMCETTIYQTPHQFAHLYGWCAPCWFFLWREGTKEPLVVASHLCPILTLFDRHFRGMEIFLSTLIAPIPLILDGLALLFCFSFLFAIRGYSLWSTHYHQRYVCPRVLFNSMRRKPHRAKQCQILRT